MSDRNKNRIVTTVALFAMAIIPILNIAWICRSQPLSEGNILPIIMPYILLIPFFFFNFYFLVPKYLLNKKEFTYLLFVVLLGAVIVFSPLALYSVQEPDSTHSKVTVFMLLENDWLLKTASSLVAVVIMLLLSLMLKHTVLTAAAAKPIGRMSAIPSEINPHFVFNTLNSLYALTIAKSDAAPDVVIKLSDMLRYIVSESRSYRVPLATEIEYVSNYVDIQRLRITERNNVTFTVSGDSSEQLIAPLTIIPFVENAFKCGVNEEEPWQIGIKITLSANQVDAEIHYIKVSTTETNQSHDSEIMTTAKRRLISAYPNSHVITLKDLPNAFHVFLQINLV